MTEKLNYNLNEFLKWKLLKWVILIINLVKISKESFLTNNFVQKNTNIGFCSFSVFNVCCDTRLKGLQSRILVFNGISNTYTHTCTHQIAILVQWSIFSLSLLCFSCWQGSLPDGSVLSRPALTLCYPWVKVGNEFVTKRMGCLKGIMAKSSNKGMWLTAQMKCFSTSAVLYLSVRNRQKELVATAQRGIMAWLLPQKLVGMDCVIDMCCDWQL